MEWSSRQKYRTANYSLLLEDKKVVSNFQDLDLIGSVVRKYGNLALFFFFW